MKFLITLAICFSTLNTHAQREFMIFLGGGFHGDTCLLIGSYFEGDKLLRDTLVNHEILESGYVVGLAKEIKTKFPKKGEYAIDLYVNNKHYLFRLDKICTKSQVRVEMYSGIDFCFRYKGGFLFY